MNLSKDEKLDLWIETNVFRRSRNKRFGVPAYTRYLNRALGALDHLDLPYTISRQVDLRWRLNVTGCKKIAIVDTSDELAHEICRLVYETIIGKPWPWEDSNA